MIRILLVDDHDDIRALMRMILERANNGLFVAGEAASGDEALAQIDRLDPTVIVLDEMMPGLSGLETASSILSRRPSQAILMCSARLDQNLRLRATGAGVRGFLSKDQITELPSAVRLVSAA